MEALRLARGPIRHLLALLLAVATAAGLVASATPPRASAAPAAETDLQVQRARSALGDAQADLVRLSAALDQAVAVYERAAAHRTRLGDELAGADEVLAAARAGVDGTRSRFHERVKGAYKRPDGEAVLAEAVLAAPDPATAVHRAALVERMTVRSAAELAEAEEAGSRTADDVRQHKIVEAGVTAAAADLQRQSDELTALVTEAQRRVDEARRRVGAAERAARERAEAAAREAQAAARAAALAASPAAAAVPAPAVSGGMTCPIGAPNGFIDSWGFPRSGGRTHKGVDIFAAYGTPLYAVADGVIRRVWNNRLGGLSVDLIDTAGNRYYYAHLSAAHVRDGQRVQVGDVIGANGNSGNARTTPPHVHWQYHPGDGPPVNPYPLVRALCR